jgi:SulP family sulfate permease
MARQESPSSSDGLSKRKFDDGHSDESNEWIHNYERKRLSLMSFLPPLTWIPAYARSVMGHPRSEDTTMAGGLPFSLKGDIIAGITVGVMLVPQCLAFALLAGLPVQVGLYSSFMPLVVYAAMGTIRQVQPGPTALMSLLTGQALDSLGLDSDAERIAGAALLAVLVGGISILLGAIRFGFIVDFMSHSVMAAFCSAAGITIGSSQLKHLLGINMERKKYWWQTISYLASHLNEIHIPTFAIGGSLLFLLLLLKYWKSAGSEDKRKKHLLWRFFPCDKTSTAFRTLKFVADLSSLGAVVIGWLWGLAYRQGDVEGVKYVGEVDGGGFRIIVPGKDAGAIKLDSFIASALVMAVVGFLETMAVGGKFAMQARYEYEPNQELLALGFSNIASGMMSGYPGTGSFSRTAVNAMFGATSLVSCAISSVLVMLAVFVLLPVIAHLPLPSLAPIIIQGAIGVIGVHDFVVAFKASKAEFLVMFATFTVSLALTVKEGLLVGFVLSVLKTMHELANPNLAVCGRLADNSFRDIRNFSGAKTIPNAVVVRMDARLSFANARKMKEFCIRAVQVRENQGENIGFVIIDGKSINHVDLTGCEMLELLAELLKSRNQSLIVANIKGPASKCLDSAGVPTILQKHGGHLCIDMEQALAIIYGEDEEGHRSLESVKELAKRVETAQVLIKNANRSMFYACGHVQCTTNLAKSGEPTSSKANSPISEPHTPSTIDSTSPYDLEAAHEPVSAGSIDESVLQNNIVKI